MKADVLLIWKSISSRRGKLRYGAIWGGKRCFSSGFCSMKKCYFSWLPRRITERQRAKKARNIKENRLRNSRSTASTPLVAPLSSPRDKDLSPRALETRCFRGSFFALFICGQTTAGGSLAVKPVSTALLLFLIAKYWAFCQLYHVYICANNKKCGYPF